MEQGDLLDKDSYQDDSNRYSVVFDASNKLGLILNEFRKDNDDFCVIVTKVEESGQGHEKVEAGDEIVGLNDDRVDTFDSYRTFLNSLKNILKTASSSEMTITSREDSDGDEDEQQQQHEEQSDDKEQKAKIDSSEESQSKHIIDSNEENKDLSNQKEKKSQPKKRRSSPNRDITLHFVKGTGAPYLLQIKSKIEQQQNSSKNDESMGSSSSKNLDDTILSSPPPSPPTSRFPSSSLFSRWTANNNNGNNNSSKSNESGNSNTSAFLPTFSSTASSSFKIPSLGSISASSASSAAIGKNYYNNFVKKIAQATEALTLTQQQSEFEKKKKMAQGMLNNFPYGVPPLVSVPQNIQLPSLGEYYERLKMQSLSNEVEKGSGIDHNWDVLLYFAFQGVPDDCRSIVWKLLLRYIPLDSTKWEQELTKQRELYATFRTQFVKTPVTGSSKDNSSRPARLHGQAWWEYDPSEKEKQQKNAMGKDDNSDDREDGGDDEDKDANENGNEKVIIEEKVFIPSHVKDEQDKGQGIDESTNESTSVAASNEIIQSENDITDASKTEFDTQVIEESKASAEVEDEERKDKKKLNVLELEATSTEDNPLNTLDSSEWNSYFENNDLREEIWKDVQRTHPGLHFFTHENYIVMERILFIYAKLNPGIRYVQGMNEILAPLFYVMKTNENGPLFQGHAEADTFFCFSNLMSEIRDMFIGSLDSEDTGIKGRLTELGDIIQRNDPELAAHFDSHGIITQFFAIRWLTTLLSREYTLPDTLRVWDSLLSDPDRFKFLLHAASAMVILRREELLKGDFAFILHALQQEETMTDIDRILRKAVEINIIESL